MPTVRPVWMALALAALLGTGVWAWSHGVDGPYLFDDHTTPLADPASQSLPAWAEHLTRTLRPLTKLTYALEAETTVTNTPAARRVVSILLHMMSAAVLWRLMIRLVPGMPVLAIVLAGVWFLHPVHADAVLLASGRTAVLSNLFVFAALLALDQSRRWLSAIFFALACLSRETAIAALLPLSVLGAGRPRATWREKTVELLPILTAGVLVASWLVATPRYRHLADYSMFGRPFWESTIAQIGAVPVGLGLLFNPSALSVDYGIPLPTRASDPLFAMGCLLYLAAAAGAFLYRGARATTVGLALWLAALLPTQSVIPKLDALANRPLSLALAGLLIAAAPALGALARTVGAAVPRRPETRRSLPTVLVTCCALVLVGFLAFATARRAVVFRSELGLWQDAAAKSSTNERPHVQYAVLLMAAGRHREARESVAAAAKINPFSQDVATLSRVLWTEEPRR